MSIVYNDEIIEGMLDYCAVLSDIEEHIPDVDILLDKIISLSSEDIEEYETDEANQLNELSIITSEEMEMYEADEACQLDTFLSVSAMDMEEYESREEKELDMLYTPIEELRACKTTEDEHFSEVSNYETQIDTDYNDSLFAISKSDIQEESDEVTAPLDLAFRIMEIYDFAYVDVFPTWNRFSIFDGIIWRECDEKLLEAIVYNYIEQEAKKNLGSSLKNYIKSVIYIIYEETYNRQSKGIFGFTKEHFDAIQNHAVFNNGVYDLVTGELMEHTNSLPYYIRINANYTETGKDVHMKKLLMDATGEDVESMKMIYRYIGYLCVPNASAKCFGMMGLAKDSGKSLLGRLITDTINNSITIDLEQFAGRFALGRFEYANIISCFELSTHELGKTETANLKRFTGERTLRAEQKYKAEKDITVRFKVLLAGNGPLRLYGEKDEAFYRRLLILPFVKSVPPEKCDASLEIKLYRERDMIFSKAVRKLAQCISENGTIHIPVSQLSKKMWTSWSNDKSVCEKFIDDCIDITNFEEDVVPCSDVYDNYIEYFKMNSGSTDDILMTSSKFRQMIITNTKGVRVSKLRRGEKDANGNHTPIQCFVGMKLKEQILE